MSEVKATTIPQIRQVIYDTYANFPATGLTTGDLAYATDRLVLYRWNGSAWQATTFHSSSGLAAAIPTAGDLPNGSLYHETDTALLKQVQSGAWVSVGSPTKEFFVPAIGVNRYYYSYFGVIRCDALGEIANMVFHIPWDFNSLSSAKILVIPTATQAAADWDIKADYGANGENYNAHSETDITTTYNVGSGQLYEVDASGILSSIAVGDYIGMQIKESTAGHNVDVVGLRFRYT